LNCSYGAVGETRTRTIIRPLPPQDSVSANSTTTAWWALQDSNLRPIGYEPTALPAELRAPTGVPEEIRTPDTRLRRPLLYPAELLGHFYLEGATGFEPVNKGFADLCLTTWLCSHVMGRPMGIEPTNVGATIRCVNHFATAAIIGRDSRNRTHAGGFGDLSSTVKLCPYWLRGQDLNLRPSGYEPDELPNCSTPRL
jgi:hypothetical protein